MGIKMQNSEIRHQLATDCSSPMEQVHERSGEEWEIGVGCLASYTNPLPSLSFTAPAITNVSLSVLPSSSHSQPCLSGGQIRFTQKAYPCLGGDGGSSIMNYRVRGVPEVSISAFGTLHRAPSTVLWISTSDNLTETTTNRRVMSDDLKTSENSGMSDNPPIQKHSVENFAPKSPLA